VQASEWEGKGMETQAKHGIRSKSEGQQAITTTCTSKPSELIMTCLFCAQPLQSATHVDICMASSASHDEEVKAAFVHQYLREFHALTAPAH